MNEQVKIKADVMWAFLDKPNEMSGKYQIDLCNLSEQAVSALEAMGIQVKNKEDKGSYITCKSSRTITAYDDGGSVVDGSVVGNGSKVAAIITPYDWTFKGKKGTSASLRKMVITELVAYSGAPLTDDDDLL